MPNISQIAILHRANKYYTLGPILFGIKRKNIYIDKNPKVVTYIPDYLISFFPIY